MEKHFDLNDDQFEMQFSSCSLDSNIFTHEAHLRLAWIHIHKYGLQHALVSVDQQLQRYVASLGASSKYNKTLTIAAIMIVNHFMNKSETRDFKNFIAENLRLKSNFKDLISAHYKTDIFTSAQAKKAYLEPELLAFA